MSKKINKTSPEHQKRPIGSFGGCFVVILCHIQGIAAQYIGLSATLMSFPRIELPAAPLCSMTPQLMLSIKLLQSPPSSIFRNLRITINQPFQVNRSDLGFFLVNNLERVPQIELNRLVFNYEGTLRDNTVVVVFPSGALIGGYSSQPSFINVAFEGDS